MRLIARRIKTLGEQNKKDKSNDNNNNNAITNYARRKEGKQLRPAQLQRRRSLQR